MKLETVKWWLRYRLMRPWLLWRDVWWWFMHRTFKRFNKVEIRSLKPGYYDMESRLLHASFQLLKDFVEREKPFDHIDWEYDEAHSHAGAEIKALYRWWTVERPARKSCVDQLADSERPKAFEFWSEDPANGGLSWGDKEARLQKLTYPKYDAALSLDRELQENWDKEDEEALIRLAKIRGYCWT